LTESEIFSNFKNLQIPHHQFQLQHQPFCQGQLNLHQGHAYMQPCLLLVGILLILVQLAEDEPFLALAAVLALTVQSVPKQPTNT
jgi:hypothetical protein